MLTGLGFLTGFVGTSSLLAFRVWIIPEFVLVWAIALWGYLFGMMRKFIKSYSKLSYVVVLLISVLALGTWLESLNAALNTEAKLHQYALAWDQRDKYIQENASTSIILTVPSFDMKMGLEDLTADGNGWVNGCMAHFYDIKGLKGEQTELKAISYSILFEDEFHDGNP
jgi:hypothetical protein